MMKTRTNATNTITLKIDGQSVCGTPIEKQQFLEFFHELETLMKSDDEQYWVLYEERNAFPWSVGEYREIFWCIPTTEIHFEWTLEDGWCYVHKPEPSPVGVVRVGRVTLDEEPEFTPEYLEAVKEYSHKLEVYDTFEAKLAHYILFNKHADEDAFRFYKNAYAWVDTKDKDVSDDNKVCLITYLEEYWGAWLSSILDEEYKYMNLTRIVWESWAER